MRTWPLSFTITGKAASPVRSSSHGMGPLGTFQLVILSMRASKALAGVVAMVQLAAVEKIKDSGWSELMKG